MDGNEPLVNDKGGITRICRECKLYNPLDHRHGDIGNTKSYIRGSNKIDFILCTYNLLKMMIACGMTAFNEVTTTDHCGGFLDLLGTIVLRNRSTPIPSPFDRRLQSNSPIAVRKYKKYLKKNITKKNIE